MIDKRVQLLVTTIVRVVVREIPIQVLMSDPHFAIGNLRSDGVSDGTTTAKGQRRVLVVDDETLIADSVAMILNRNGYAAQARYSGGTALESVRDQCPDIIVSDVVMPDFNGIQLAKAVRAICPAARIVLFSGNVDASSLLDDASIEGYFFEILAKPIHPLSLLKALDGPSHHSEMDGSA
ncbi:MAG TPA: response regulator [Terracidiphilus sp.]|jgi:CheY-like chemotaxis protein|nr:response regulator [Terracidiphilus sp.]